MPRRPYPNVRFFELLETKIPKAGEQALGHIDNINTDGGGYLVGIIWHGVFKTPKGAKTILLRVRRGSGTGPQITPTVKINVAAEQAISIPFGVCDTIAGDLGGTSYWFTAEWEGAEGETGELVIAHITCIY